MFEPGDRVKIKGDETKKVWTVLRYPYKMWHDYAVAIGDEDGRERAVDVKTLEKVEDKPYGGGCGDGYCDFGEEEMRLE